MRARRLPCQEVEIGARRIVNDPGERGGLAARHPDRVVGRSIGKSLVRHERKAAARGLEAG
jgi:hypothetical protein